MNDQDAISILKSIIAVEKKDGCPMAGEWIIEPTLRRWKSYERRNKRNKNKTLEHRTLYLKKGILAVYPDFGYDEACIAQLAQSFAEALYKGTADVSGKSAHV